MKYQVRKITRIEITYEVESFSIESAAEIEQSDEYKSLTKDVTTEVFPLDPMSDGDELLRKESCFS